ncbi:MAG TPA: LuxR C-terminal-related transcriptional regulator [Streptosporangiaceae bacterium]|nr:LuxR C-terminal-related transcriptional regulator [Streptosporangiaceae bacterium]
MTSTISEPAAGHKARESAAAWPARLGRAVIERRLTRDKLRVPRPSVPLLHRQRVTNLIQCAAALRVTTVCGPTGAGKTIACALWATGHASAGNIAWVSLDPGDREPGRLWSHVSAAFCELPAASDLAGDLPDPDDPSFPLRLTRAAERLTVPVTLVIDDVQALTGSDSLAGLDQLVRHGPASVRLLLAGRHLNGLSVARLRVGGDLAEIGASELACTAPEARAYFEMLGIELPAEQLDELLARTEGWITGLRLAAMRSGPDRAARVPWRITGDEPQVADYLRDEILATQPDSHRDFLLRTSVADRICGDLADTLTAGKDGSAILDRLCRENVMIRPEGPGPEIEYRYHPLLLDLLRAQLRRDLPAELPLLANRAARWQAARGQHADALRSAAAGGDWDFAASVLAEAGPELLLPGPALALEPVLAAFPSSRFTSDAAVAGALAAAGLRTGDGCATQLHLDNARAALDSCPADQRPMISAWLQALQLMHAITTGQAAKAVPVPHQATVSAGTAAEHQAAGLLSSATGVVALASLRIADAREALDHARGQLSQGGRAEFLARARGWSAIAEAMYGDCIAARNLISATEEDGGGGDALAPRLARIGAVYLHLAKDETAIARRLLDEHEATGTTRDPGASVAETLATLAKVRLALCQGDHGTARRLVTRLRYDALAAPDGPYHAGQASWRDGISAAARAAGGAFHTELTALDADIALGEDDLARAKLVVARATADDETRRLASLQLAAAKTQLAEGDSAAALSTVESLAAATSYQVTLLDRISALVLAAIADRRLGEAGQAADRLGYALTLAEPHGLYRPFLDGGSAARSALTVLIRPTSQGAAVAARILQRFEIRPSRPAGTPASVPLTGSELAVLRFLPSHMTNQEIAEALFLSINTVKTHLRSVYRKLGVTTRRQAISSAGRLGLL